jgi:N-acetylglucosamine malate deacetylase 1
MKKVLVIAPHPDDEVLGCGGTIAKHVKNGDNVFLCVVTKAYAPEWPEEEITQRRKEVLKVNKILGIKKTYFLDLPTVKLDILPQKEINALISGTVNEVKPEILYIPNKGDVNSDHKIVFNAAMIAARPRGVSAVQRILSYETLSETEWSAPYQQDSFIPNIYIDITDTLKIKLKAMSGYKLELKDFPHPRSLETISAQAKLRGSTVGKNAAEAFMLIREIQS